jgi:hypothetical protein
MTFEPTHEVRNSINDPSRTFRLHSDRLSWQEADRQQERLYTAIATVHLIAYPGYGGEQLQCTLIDRAGKKLKIHSHHYVSLGRFEDRSASYGMFVRELAARLGTYGNGVAFRHGSGVMHAVWTSLFWLSVVVLAGFAFAFVGGQRPSVAAISSLTVVAMFLPVTRVMIGRNVAGTFDPKAPPGSLLGDK